MALTTAQIQKLVDKYGVVEAMEFVACLMDVPQGCMFVENKVVENSLRKENVILRQSIGKAVEEINQLSCRLKETQYYNS